MLKKKKDTQKEKNMNAHGKKKNTQKKITAEACARH